MTGIDYEPRMLFNPLRDGGDGSGGVKGEYEHVSSLSQKIIMRTKDILSSSRMKRLAPGVLYLGLLATSLGGSTADAPRHKAPPTQDCPYWEEAFHKLRGLGVDPTVERERWEEVLTGLFETCSEPEPAVVHPDGLLYTFPLAAEEDIVVTFPEELGGETQTLSLDGDLTLFIEEPPADCATEEPALDCEAPMWIYDMREVIRKLRLPIDGRYVEIDEFVIDTNMFSPKMFDPNKPHGTINSKTGEYTLTYTLQPTHSILQEMGVETVGTIEVNERGKIGFNNDGKAVSIEMRGSLNITDGPFAGITITYGQVPLDQSDKEEDTEQKN